MALLELTPNLLWFGQIKSATHSWRKKPTYRYAVSEIGLARIGQLIDFRGEERAWRYALRCRAEDYAESCSVGFAPLKPIT